MKTSLAIATAALMFSAILSLTGVAVACYDSLSPKGPRAAPAQPNSINPQAQIAVGNGNEDARLATPGGEASRQSFGVPCGSQ